MSVHSSTKVWGYKIMILYTDTYREDTDKPFLTNAPKGGSRYI